MATKPPTKTAQPPLEFSRPLKVTAITQRLDTISVEATAEECVALATRFELAGLESLSATLEYRRLTGTQRIWIEGVITAQTAQHCVASWEPVPETVHENFVADFTQTVWETADTEMDQPEVITEDVIDLGELVAQYFYLALEPYPRMSVAEPPPEKPKRAKKTVVKPSPVKSKPARRAKAPAGISATASIEDAASPLSVEDFVATISNAPTLPMPIETFLPVQPPVGANDAVPISRNSLFMEHLQRLKKN